MNHCINLGVQIFLKTCKVLREIEDVEDEDLATEDKEATRIRGGMLCRKEVETAAEDFQSMMWKLHETAKIFSYSTQIIRNLPWMQFVCYKISHLELTYRVPREHHKRLRSL